jgi:hypothetical protein
MTNNTQKMIDTLKAQLAKIEADLLKSQTQSASDAGQAAVLDAVTKAGGHLAVTQIMAECHMTKGTAWRHINALDRAAKVWLQTTSRGVPDGRKHTVVWAADAIAT